MSEDKLNIIEILRS